MCEVLLAAVLAVVPVDRLLEVRHDAEHGRCSEGSVIDLGKDGLLFAYTRYGKGHGDHDDAQIVTRRSSDGGRTWTDDRVAVEKPAGTLNVMSASLLRMKDGRIALFNMLKNDTADARPQMRISSDGGETWGEARFCISEKDRGYYVQNNDRAVRLRSGRILLPQARHSLGTAKFNWCANCVCVLSDDDGATWRLGRPAPQPKAEGYIMVQEPGVVETEVGLVMWARTNRGAQWWTRSSDGGETWGEWTESPLVSPLSPAQIVRLRDGRLCAAWNDHSMFPEMKERCGKNGLGGRTPMVLGISMDGGRTWPIRCAIENDLKGYFAYPSVREVGDDLVLSYSCFEGLKDIRVVRVPLAGLRSASL